LPWILSGAVHAFLDSLPDGSLEQLLNPSTSNRRQQLTWLRFIG
jgi:hypothetical protein